MDSDRSIWFYKQKHIQLFLFGMGVIKEHDKLQRLYTYHRVFIIVGPYEFGIMKRSDIKTNKGDK